MDVIELIQKQYPDFGRKALFDAFINAHFSEATGELLGNEYEFHRVLNLLGRKDLNLGDIPNRIEKITFKEKKAIYMRFHELTRSAPKSKKSKNEKRLAGPYLKHLTQTEMMALEAFNSSGDVVTNPAVATTLVQAHLEGWLPVAALPMDAKEILIQCKNQGDMQAAFLLGTKCYSSIEKNDESEDSIGGDEKPKYLVGCEEERSIFLKEAMARGNPAAIAWLKDEELRKDLNEGNQESIQGGDDDFYLNIFDSDIKRALKFGPESSGKEKFRWGVKLAEDNEDHFRYLRKEISDQSIYRSRHALAVQWIYEAAITDAEARYYIATSAKNFHFRRIVSPLRPAHLDEIIELNNLTDAEIKWKLIESAAFPGECIDPYYPAFIDLAEQALSRMSQSSSVAEKNATKFDEVRRYLVEGVDRIEKPDCKQALRIAHLWESVDIDGRREKVLHHYSIAAKESPFAAFKCAMISLRSLRPGQHDISTIKSYFELAVNHPNGYSASKDETSKRYSEIALKIGWGTHLDPSSWEEASMLLMKQLDTQSYISRSHNAFILPSDVELLIQLNPSYQEYKIWLKDWKDVLSVRDTEDQQPESEAEVGVQMDKKLRSIYFLYGASDPSSAIKLLAGIANDPDYLQFENAMKGIDGSSLLIKYLLSQLTMQEKYGYAKATGGFREVLTMTESLQASPGGRGISFIANCLQWMQKKSLEGIDDAQPNCRKISLGSEMNGDASQFGSKLIDVIFKNLENWGIPGNAVATEVIYKDRYINTPLRVAILANTVEAIVGHLRACNRWGSGSVQIYAGHLQLPKNEENGSFNHIKSFRDDDERNLILKEILIRAGIKIATPKTKPPHGRELIVRFADACELRVGLDKGMSYWTAVSGGDCSINDYNPYGNIDQKVACLAETSVKIGQTEDACPLYVEWYDINGAFQA